MTCIRPTCRAPIGTAGNAAVIACPGDTTARIEVFCLSCAREVLGPEAFQVPMYGARVTNRRRTGT